jgi:hypothetical protein
MTFVEYQPKIACNRSGNAMRAATREEIQRSA